VVLKEVHVTIGERAGDDLSSHDVDVSISLINEAGLQLNRRRANIVHEETLMNPFSAAWMVGRAVRDLLLQAR
jgi:hypothetical protein